MKDDISSVSIVGVATNRVTRARAASLKENVGVLRGKGNVLQNQKRPPRPPLSKASPGVKTSVTERIGKRKAVLQDVTNVCSRSSSCASADTIRIIKKAKKDGKGLAVATSVSTEPHYSKDHKRPPRPPLSKAPPGVKISVTERIGKRKAVLQDVTNVCSRSSSCASADTIRNIKKAKKDGKGLAVAASVSTESHYSKAVSNANSETTSKNELIPKSELVNFSSTVDPRSHNLATRSTSTQRIRTSKKPMLPRSVMPKAARKSSPEKKIKKSSDPVVSDLDSDSKDPLLCTLYAPEIHNYLRVAELNRRPSSNYMENKQRDISQSMRGILVDWLVEVSEEYKLASDTLYLTVFLVDWFLSNNFIERQKLQLLGITSMLIASKYEEICAPRVEDFCYVTGNTYTKEEVIQMEIRVLSNVNFQLYTPTAKSFLRRFIRAAQASYERPSLELEYLSDYLAELTLLDCDFIKFLPSTIAASAVFLARWTLFPSAHPWNATLEHYTLYKSSDLKSSVLALRDLQLNTNNCPLHVIRAKYSQQKYKSVAAMFSPKLPEKLF